MNTKRTPGEWRFEETDFTIRTNDFTSKAGMGDYRGVIIVELDSDKWRKCRPNSVGEKKANGTFICTAVNAHDLAKAALESFRQEWNTPNTEISEKTFELVISALAKMRGETTRYDAHDELVEALEKIEEEFVRMGFDWLNPVRKVARAALAKAKGE